MNITNWYWLADDGRIFSSASETLVLADDPAYVAWCKTYSPTPWPRDDDGNQTDAALQAVLAPFNIYISLKDYSASVRYQFEIDGTVSTGGQKLRTDRVSRTALNQVLNEMQSGTTTSVNWKTLTGFVVWDKTMVEQYMSDLIKHVQETFDVELSVASGIDAGTITTQAQVDAAYDGLSAKSPKLGKIEI